MSLLQLALVFLRNILDQYVKAGAPKEVIDGIIAVIAKIEEVHGTEVTLGQLEELRVAVPDWPASH